MTPQRRLAIAIGVTALGAVLALVGLIAIAVDYWPAALAAVGFVVAIVGALTIDIPSSSAPKERGGRP